MTYITAKTQIAATIAAVAGIRKSPTNAPEKINEFPFAVTYLFHGVSGGGPVGTHKSLYTVYIDVLTKRNDLANDFALLDPFVDTIPAALEAQVVEGGGRFSGTVSEIGDIEIQYITPNYAGVEMRGYRFIINKVKIIGTT